MVSQKGNINMYLLMQYRPHVIEWMDSQLWRSSGNNHDNRTFKSLYDKIKGIGIETLIADARI